MINVSVIIPAYNSAHLIGQTILSVLKQQYSKWEMIIVDDGSTDAITGIVNFYAEKDKRIKLYHQSNKGASAARNTGVKKAKYEWILFLDADDWIREDYFDKMIPVLANDPSIDIVHCGWTRVGKDAMNTKENYGGEQSDMFFSLSYHCPFAIHSCIVRKTLIEQIGSFDTSFKTCGDWDLWQRAARAGARFQMVKEVMAYYRIISGSLSSDGTQFCKNGLQVISQAYAADLRVPNSNPKHVNGLHSDDLLIRKFHFITWSAGLLIGEAKPASHLLKHLNGATAGNMDPNFIAEILLDSVVIPLKLEQSHWHKHWYVVEEHLKTFLEELEKHCDSKGLAEEAISIIGRHVIAYCAEDITQMQIGKNFALKIDVEEPLQDISVPGNIEFFFGIIQLQGKILGMIELPVSNNFLPVSLVKDAIATKFSWQILQYFFSIAVYSSLKVKNELLAEHLKEEEIHDKIGWKCFLQELWQQPDWTSEMFYNQFIEKEEISLVKPGDVVHIEITEKLPAVKMKTSILTIIYSVGGVNAGIAACNFQSRYASPQMLRAAINLNSGYDLCRIAVREALIGDKLNNGINLLERLKRNRLREKNY